VSARFEVPPGSDPAWLIRTDRRVEIIEADCIGCAKCLAACPVDAIIGAPRQMHTVMVVDCIGCELCIPPCPVDCIEVVSLPPAPALTAAGLAERHHRYRAHLQRLGREPGGGSDRGEPDGAPHDREAMRAEIRAAIERVRARRRPPAS